MQKDPPEAAIKPPWPNKTDNSECLAAVSKISVLEGKKSRARNVSYGDCQCHSSSDGDPPPSTPPKDPSPINQLE